MDVVVIIFVLGAVAVMIFKKFNNLVYYIAFMDILFRVLAFIADNIPIDMISDLLSNYFPNSVSNVIDVYSSGIFTTVLIWLLVIIYIILDYYLIRLFLKKK